MTPPTRVQPCGYCSGATSARSRTRALDGWVVDECAARGVRGLGRGAARGDEGAPLGHGDEGAGHGAVGPARASCCSWPPYMPLVSTRIRTLGWRRLRPRVVCAYFGLPIDAVQLYSSLSLEDHTPHLHTYTHTLLSIYYRPHPTLYSALLMARTLRPRWVCSRCYYDIFGTSLWVIHVVIRQKGDPGTALEATQRLMAP
jgi:hypothetical protein